MVERFTDEARQVVRSSVEEARLLAHDHVGTEHILPGLMREGKGLGAEVLDRLGCDKARLHSGRPWLAAGASHERSHGSLDVKRPAARSAGDTSSLVSGCSS